MQVLPTFPDEPAVVFKTTLDGVRYTITYRWQERTASWYLDLATGQGEPLVSGVRLAVDWVPLAGHRATDPRIPQGALLVYSTDRSNTSPPGFSDLGRRVRLAYHSADEVEALLSAGDTSTLKIEVVP